ncbi:MAG: hypothetical protein M1836_002208 [Candelina mexicana]|nr:MAG: hypothetical protein M1836_002208 [Candelina mexicana]
MSNLENTLDHGRPSFGHNDKQAKQPQTQQGQAKAQPLSSSAQPNPNLESQLSLSDSFQSAAEHQIEPSAPQKEPPCADQLLSSQDQATSPPTAHDILRAKCRRPSFLRSFSRNAYGLDRFLDPKPHASYQGCGKASETDQDTFLPLMVTIGRESRDSDAFKSHIVICVPIDTFIDDLKLAILEELRYLPSPNIEFEGRASAVGNMYVYWTRPGGAAYWPEKTTVTKRNLPALLLLLDQRGGQDVLQVQLDT